MTPINIRLTKGVACHFGSINWSSPTVPFEELLVLAESISLAFNAFNVNNVMKSTET